MKYKNLLIIALLAIHGCSGWLDIRPQREISEEDEFATEWGFQDVLIGVYSQMSNQILYGMHTSILVPELLAQHWSTTSSELVNNSIREFNLDNQNVEPLLASIWLQYYKAIANLNSLLAAIDSREALFVDGNYDLVKGEAIGLRAFLHFDLLRFWGASPANASGGETAIPYMKIMTKDPNLLRSITHDEVLQQIENDLNIAETLLQHDPIMQYPPSVLNQPGTLYTDGTPFPENSFHYYRQNRFNIQAVKATKARYYLWKGDKTLALKHAKEVIDAVDATTGKPLFTLADEASMTGINLSSPDLIMTSEHIFAIHNTALQNILAPQFITLGGLTRDRTDIREAFEANTHPNDIRAKEPRNWEEKIDPRTSQRQYIFKKYLVDDSESVQVIPLVRLAEMYLIAIECAPLDEANELLRHFRISRNMESFLDNSLVDATSTRQRLEKEYRKEFYGEGQMFFYYKRHGIPYYSWPTPFTVDPSKYKFPKPNDQIIYE
jgi:hypothetical protein